MPQPNVPTCHLRLRYFMSILVFILLFIALIKGSIVYSSAKQANASRLDYLKPFGCFMGFSILIIFYIIIKSSIRINSFSMMCIIDGGAYLFVSIMLIKPYAIRGAKNILTFILGGFFANLLFLVLLMLLYAYTINTVSSFLWGI